MARSKRLLILLAVLAAACIAAFAALHWQEKQEQIAVSGEEVLSIDPDSVQSLSWTYGGTSLAFSRDETGGWTYDNDAAFPVDPEVMEGLLTPFAPFSAAFVIEDAEDGGQYGLDDPELTVTAEYTAESETGQTVSGAFTLHISRDPEERALAEEDGAADEEETITAYVRVEGSSIVYRITSLEYTYLTMASYDDLRHDEVLTADFADIQSIDVTLDGETVYNDAATLTNAGGTSQKYLYTMSYTNRYVGVALGQSAAGGTRIAAVQTLTSAKADAEDFFLQDGDWYVESGRQEYRVSDRVQIHLTEADLWLEGAEGLASVLADGYTLTLYYDRSADEGGQVRLITAQ